MMEEMEFETVELERIKMGISMALNKELLEPSVRFFEDHFYNHVQMMVHGYLWGRNEEYLEIKYPLDWWQAFKERWFPKSLLTKWPVIYKKHKIDVREIYPHYRPALSDQTFRLKLAKYDSTDYVC